MVEDHGTLAVITYVSTLRCKVSPLIRKVSENLKSVPLQRTKGEILYAVNRSVMIALDRNDARGGFRSSGLHPHDRKYSETAFNPPTLASAERPFSWGKNFVTPGGSSIHPLIVLPESSSSSVMICPLPLCSLQSNELVSITALERSQVIWCHIGEY